MNDPRSLSPDLVEAITVAPEDSLRDWCALADDVKQAVWTRLMLRSVPQEKASLLTAEDLAKRFNIPVSKVYSMARRGEIEKVMVGRYLRFTPEAAQAYLDRDPS